MYDRLHLPRIERAGERYYRTPDGTEMPSVTSILKATTPAAKLAILTRWAQGLDDRLGVGTAERVRDDTARRGTLIHEAAERLLIHSRDECHPAILDWWQHLGGWLYGLLDVAGVEMPLWHPGGWAGTADLIAVVDGRLTVCDFKTTDLHERHQQSASPLEFAEWRKKRASTDRAKLREQGMQLAAYAMAFRHCYGVPVNRGLILTVDRVEPMVLSAFDGPAMASACAEWRDRMEAYLALPS